MKDTVKGSVVKALKNKIKLKKSMSGLQVYQSKANALQRRKDNKTDQFLFAVLVLAYFSILYSASMIFVLLPVTLIALIYLIYKNNQKNKFIDSYFKYLEFDLITEYQDSVNKFVEENPEKKTEINHYIRNLAELKGHKAFRNHLASEIFFYTTNKKDKSLSKINNTGSDLV